MYGGRGFRPYNSGLAWRYYEDVRGKPGWIVENITTTSRTITFNITVGPMRRVHVSYLRTYGSGLGSVLCSIGCPPRAPGCRHVKLKTEQADHVSQAAIGLLTDSGWQVGARVQLRCDASLGKSKLLGICSC
jgi:hypothetical protein